MTCRVDNKIHGFWTLSLVTGLSGHVANNVLIRISSAQTLISTAITFFLQLVAQYGFLQIIIQYFHVWQCYTIIQHCPQFNRTYSSDSILYCDGVSRLSKNHPSTFLVHYFWLPRLHFPSLLDNLVTEVQNVTERANSCLFFNVSSYVQTHS